MSVHLVDRLAQHIRKAVGDNQPSASELGYEIAARLPVRPRFDSTDLIRYVKAINPDGCEDCIERLPADDLAKTIVTEFDLDKETER